MNSVDATKEFMYSKIMSKKAIEPTKQISVRFPDSIYSEIESISDNEHRSLANVVIVLAREALDLRKSQSGANTASQQ